MVVALLGALCSWRKQCLKSRARSAAYLCIGS